MKKPNNYTQNMIRKAGALRRCLEVLEDLQENHAPIFREDPMITGYEAQLQRDLDALEKCLQEE